MMVMCLSGKGSAPVGHSQILIKGMVIPFVPIWSVRLIKPSFAPLNEIKALFNLHSIESSFSLCQNVFHPKEICKSCGAVPKAGETFNRHSPDSQKVTEHLRKTIDSDINIAPQGQYICMNGHPLLMIRSFQVHFECSHICG